MRQKDSTELSLKSDYWNLPLEPIRLYLEAGAGFGRLTWSSFPCWKSKHAVITWLSAPDDGCWVLIFWHIIWLARSLCESSSTRCSWPRAQTLETLNVIQNSWDATLQSHSNVPLTTIKKLSTLQEHEHEDAYSLHLEHGDVLNTTRNLDFTLKSNICQWTIQQPMRLSTWNQFLKPERVLQ